MLLGAHVSAAGGIWNAISNGMELNCTAIQIFTANARTWKTKSLSEDEIEKFLEAKHNSTIKKVVAHASYLPNLASPDEELFERSVENIINDLNRCSSLGIENLVLHPGSSKDKGIKFGTKRVAEAVDIIYSQLLKNQNTTNISLETTAGSGNLIGSRFEELADIMNTARYSEYITIALDTCHMFTAGYDIRSKLSYKKTMSHLFQQLTTPKSG